MRRYVTVIEDPLKLVLITIRIPSTSQSDKILQLWPAHTVAKGMHHGVQYKLRNLRER